MTAPIKILSLLASFSIAIATGCATSPEQSTSNSRQRTRPPEESFAEAPTWVSGDCRAFWEKTDDRRRLVCGVGSAPANRNRVRARETAIARARSEIARSLQVTIENIVRLEDHEDGSSDFDSIVDQLSSASLRGCRTERVWRSASGEYHALVSLDVTRVQGSVRGAQKLPPATRESIAKRAEDAFAEMDAAFEAEEQ